MTINRIVYCIILLIFGFLAGLSGGGAAYSVLLSIVLIPVVSFILTVAINSPVCGKLQIYGLLNVNQAGKGETVEYKITVNNKSIIPLLCVRVVFGRTSIGISIKKTTGFFSVPSRGTSEFTCELTGVYRGVYDVSVQKLIIYEPFGLLGFICKTTGKQTFTVLPRISSLDDLGIGFEIANRIFNTEVISGNRINFEENIYETAGLRAYRQADEFRRIHWAATSRRNELISKEYEQSNNCSLLFILDNSSMAKMAKPTRAIKKSEDRLMELLSSVMHRFADGKTDITLWHFSSKNDEREYVRTCSQSFEYMYAAVSAVEFDGDGNIATLLNHATNEKSIYNNIFVFTKEPLGNEYPEFVYFS